MRNAPGEQIRPRLPPWALLLAAYLLSRAMVLAAMGVVSTLDLGGARCGSLEPRPIVGLGGLARCWDTAWFIQAATGGYPSQIAGAGAGQSTLAFFPGYPALIAAAAALGVPPVGAAVGLSLALGAVATLLVRRLALCVTSPEAAQHAGLLFCFFPGAFALSWGYSEALCAALAGACLLLLWRRRWVPAGVAGALASASRADVGVALVAACAVAAVLAQWPRRDPSAWWAPALAPVGAVAFLGYLWWSTGSATTWTTTQSRGWGQRMDSGSHAVHTIGRVLVDPFRSPTSAIQLAAIVLFAAGVVAVVQHRPPLPWLAYTAVLTLLMLSSSQVGFRPRAELMLLPVFVAAGAQLGRRALPGVLVVLAMLQTLFTVLYLGAPRILSP